MSDTVVIAGMEVALDDPCAIASQLKKVRIKVVMGEAVAMTRFDQDEVRFTEASLPRLDALIADYQTQCDRLSGTRRRAARGVRWS